MKIRLPHFNVQSPPIVETALVGMLIVAAALLPSQLLLSSVSGCSPSTHHLSEGHPPFSCVDPDCTVECGVIGGVECCVVWDQKLLSCAGGDR